MTLYLGFAGEHYYPRGGSYDLVAISRRLSSVRSAVEAANRVYVRAATEAYTVTVEQQLAARTSATMTSDMRPVGSLTDKHIDAHPAQADSGTWGHILWTPRGTRSRLSLVNDGDGAWHWNWEPFEPWDAR